jgi:cytochrome P450
MFRTMKEQSPPWLRPFIYRIFKNTKDPLAFFEGLVKDADIVRLPLFKPNFIVNSPEAIYRILLTNRDNYTKAGTSYEKIENLVGKGLLTTSEEEWAKRRHQFQPHFRDKSIKDCIPTIYKYCEQMLNQWENKSGRTLNIGEEMLALTMNISSEALIGVDVSSRSLEMVKMIHRLNAYAVSGFPVWKWFPTLRNLRYQIAKRIVDNVILMSLTKQDTSTKPLLEELFLKNKDDKSRLSDHALLGEVKNFFLAGHETTGNALTWTLFCLAKHPYILMQVLKELKHVVGSRQVDSDTLEALPYLDGVIQESLRLYPPIWTFTRQTIDEDKLGNYLIPANAIVNILPYLIHRHPNYWTQPTVFYPERFFKEMEKTRPKCVYIPFGFGPRVCIAKQFALLNMKVILILILQRFEIHLPRKNTDVQPLPLITLKPHRGLYLRIKKR